MGLLLTDNETTNKQLAVLLMSFGLICDFVRAMVDNYDSAFKVMTLIALGLSILIYAEKLLSKFFVFIIRIYRRFKWNR